MDKEEKRFIQQVTGKFLFYGRAVDPTLLTSLNEIASQQSSPTTETMNRVKQFLDYVASQEDAVITYRKSEMQLAGHSDAGYLNAKKCKKQGRRTFLFVRQITTSTKQWTSTHHFANNKGGDVVGGGGGAQSIVY